MEILVRLGVIRVLQCASVLTDSSLDDSKMKMLSAALTHLTLTFCSEFLSLNSKH